MRLSWHVRLSPLAERDFLEILRWTAEHFGRGQARVYATTLRLALKVLVDGPGAQGRFDFQENWKAIQPQTLFLAFFILRKTAEPGLLGRVPGAGLCVTQRLSAPLMPAQARAR